MHLENISSWYMTLFLGIIHALEPGHGKSALFAYLISGKKSWLDGLIISLSSALTHTVMVLVLASLSHIVVHHEHHSHPYIRYISTGIIIAVGLYYFFKKKSEPHCCHGHDHHDGPADKKSSFMVSGLLGTVAGLIPCPTIIVAYLSGVSTGNSLSAMKSVLFFALGMAITLMILTSLFSFGGERVQGFFQGSEKLKSLNWNKLQGSLFLVAGVYTFIVQGL